MGRVVPSAEDGRKHPVSHRVTVTSLGGRKCPRQQVDGQDWSPFAALPTDL